MLSCCLCKELWLLSPSRLRMMDSTHACFDPVQLGYRRLSILADLHFDVVFYCCSACWLNFTQHTCVTLGFVTVQPNPQRRLLNSKAIFFKKKCKIKLVLSNIGHRPTENDKAEKYQEVLSFKIQSRIFWNVPGIASYCIACTECVHFLLDVKGTGAQTGHNSAPKCTPQYILWL